MSEIYGWCGKILKVDLTNSKISELNTMDYAARFLEGRGLATQLYWEMVSPEVGAFDPGNCLILMTGPLTATGAQGASRFEVLSKSPMRMPEEFYELRGWDPETGLQKAETLQRLELFEVNQALSRMEMTR